MLHVEYSQLDQKCRTSLYTQKPVLQYSNRFSWVKTQPNALPIYRLFFRKPSKHAIHWEMAHIGSLKFRERWVGGLLPMHYRDQAQKKLGCDNSSIYNSHLDSLWKDFCTIVVRQEKYVKSNGVLKLLKTFEKQLLTILRVNKTDKYLPNIFF